MFRCRVFHAGPGLVSPCVTPSVEGRTCPRLGSRQQPLRDRVVRAAFCCSRPSTGEWRSTKRGRHQKHTGGILDAGDWISLSSGAIAGVAAGIAVWQARMAKRSAAAADRQVVAAEQQVAAAQQQAEAAQQQVAIMARQLAYQAEDRAQADAPKFEVLSAELSYGSNEARITVAQTAGTELSSVTVTARHSANIRGLINGDGLGAVHWGATGPGCVYKLRMSLAQNFDRPVHAVLILECRDATGERTWRRTLTVTPKDTGAWDNGFTFK